MWTLQNLDIDDFLANTWQRKPLLIRQAIAGFQTLISPQELAGLACEEGVHSRLVIEKDGETPWQLRYGPFAEEDFTSLPPTHYSLLVSECEKWIPELRPLVELFNFIPRWRIDDLMISYAPDQGSVGPHIDEYDVFLIQAQGTRRWSIIDQPCENPELIKGPDLAIMKSFDADQSWLLQPGDMLYLPAKIAHHGVAEGDGCMTCSVGFRAPSLGDVMDSFLLEASDRGLTDQRYRDHHLQRGREPAELLDADIQHFRAMAEQLLQRDELWPTALGSLLSDCSLSPDIEGMQCATLDEAMDYSWQRHPDCRLFFHQSQQTLHLFANGKTYPLDYSTANREWCIRLCEESLICIPAGLEAELAQLLLQLINAHALIPVTEDDDD